MLAGLDLGRRRDPSGRATARPVVAPAGRQALEMAAAIHGDGLTRAVRLLGALVTLGHVLPGGATPDQRARNRFWAQVQGAARHAPGEAAERDLVAGVARGSLPPVVPRDDVTGRVVEVLCRLRGRVVALVGPEGVGKGSVVADLAWRIAQGAVAAPVRPLRLVGLEGVWSREGARMGDYLAGWLDQPVGDCRVPVVDGATFRLLLEEDAAALGRLLLAYEASHRPLLLVTSAPLLDRLGRQWPESLARVARVPVSEPRPPFVEQVVRWQAARIGAAGGVQISDGACDTAVEVGQRVLRGRFFPAKAVDLLDDAVGRAVAAGKGDVSAEDVRDAASAAAGIPIDHLDPQGMLLPNLARDLERRVVGQEEAIGEVAERLRVVKGSYDQEPHRPDGVFLFTGPSGVGKTELAEALAEALFGVTWRRHLIRKHMSEFSEAVAVTKLISAAPGYEGHATTRTLVDEVRERPASVLLLDEMEKAHPEVHTLFLQVFEEGLLTDARGRTAQFGEVTVVMTTNVYEDLDARLGFERDKVQAHEAFDEEAALLKVFPRELVNRFSDTIRFRRLAEGDLATIVRCHLVPNLRARLARDGVVLTVEEGVCGWLAEKGESARYGARQLARIFDDRITVPIVARLHGERAQGGSAVRVSVGDGGPALRWEGGGRPARRRR